MSDEFLNDPQLSPQPILEAAESYQGTITNLESGVQVTADQLALAREILISQFHNFGVTPGDRVLIALPNGAEFVSVLTALLVVEASPLLVHFQTPAAELRRYAERFGLRFLITEPNDLLNSSEMISHHYSLQVTNLSDLVLGLFPEPPQPAPGPVLKAVPLHPTSGSTGLPKIGLRPGFAAMEEARHYAETMEVSDHDCIMAFPPMSHAYGYGVCTMLPLLTGADIVTWKKFNPGLLSRALNDFAVTILPAVPATIDLLSLNTNLNYSHLRWLLAAGSMLMGKSATTFRQLTGVTVCPLYGTTETGGISVATNADGRDIDGRVGPPMKGVEVEVWPPEEAENLEEGIGKIYVRSSSMMYGYLDENGNITKPFRDGWFETGDLACIDSDETIHLRGRNSEMINIAGLKVVPCEVEEVLLRFPGVRETKVYAGTTKSGSEYVKVAVAADSSVTSQMLFRHCEEHLVYYKRPALPEIHMIENLPRSPSGKIMAHKLP